MLLKIHFKQAFSFEKILEFSRSIINWMDHPYEQYLFHQKYKEYQQSIIRRKRLKMRSNWIMTEQDYRDCIINEINKYYLHHWSKLYHKITEILLTMANANMFILM